MKRLSVFALVILLAAACGKEKGRDIIVDGATTGGTGSGETPIAPSGPDVTGTWKGTCSSKVMGFYDFSGSSINQSLEIFEETGCGGDVVETVEVVGTYLRLASAKDAAGAFPMSVSYTDVLVTFASQQSVDDANSKSLCGITWTLYEQVSVKGKTCVDAILSARLSAVGQTGILYYLIDASGKTMQFSKNGALDSYTYTKL